MAAAAAAPKRVHFEPRVVHCKREGFDVYVGRKNADIPEEQDGGDGRWGNQFLVGRYSRAQAIEKFCQWLLTDPAGQRTFAAARAQLRGKTLGCWCAPNACHGDVLLQIANAPAFAAGDRATQSVPSQLSLRNAHSLDACVRFEEDGSPRYRWADTGEPMVSVTEFVGSLFREFDADRIIEEMMRNTRRWNSGPYAGMTRTEVKERWEYARNLGSQMHARIADHYETGAHPGYSPEIEQFRVWDREWRAARGWQPHRVEWRLGVHSHRLAGTPDAVFRRADGYFALVDWKRCAKPIVSLPSWPRCGLPGTPAEKVPDCDGQHYRLQTLLYAHLLSKVFGCEIREIWLVRLHPDTVFGTYEPTEIFRDEALVEKLLAYRLAQVTGGE